MENKETRRVRFNIFDLLILLLVAAVGVGVLALRNRAAGTETGRETVPMRCTVEFVRAAHGMSEALHVGDSVYRSTDGTYIGKLVDFTAVPHREIEYSALAGAFVAYDYRETDDLYMTIEGDCYATEREVMFGSVPVRIGSELAVKGRGYAKVGYVVGLDRMGAEMPENTAAISGDGTAVYTIAFDDTRSFFADNIHVGDRFYEYKTGGFLGIVEDVSMTPYGETKLDAEGTPQWAEKPDRYTILVRLRGGFVDKPDGYYLGGTSELKTGAFVTVESQYITRMGIYSSIESIEAAP